MDKVIHNVNIYNRFVKEYMKRFMDLELYRDTFEYLLASLPMDSRVLELGCGPGNVIKYLSSQRPDLHFLGIDLAPEMIKAAQLQNPAAQFRMLDIRNLDQLREKFDAVILPFCIPYLEDHDLPGIFNNLTRLTVENGIIYMSCMEGEREASGFEKTSFTPDTEMYINYYPRKDIDSFIVQHGFEIKKFYTKNYREVDGTITVDLFFLAEKS